MKQSESKCLTCEFSIIIKNSMDLDSAFCNRGANLNLIQSEDTMINVPDVIKCNKYSSKPNDSASKR